MSDRFPGERKVDFVSLLSAAQSHVRASCLYERFIDGTPLSNDIAVWMAEFAASAIRDAPVGSVTPASSEALGNTSRSAAQDLNASSSSPAALSAEQAKELGLNVDMLDVDRLRDWARLVEDDPLVTRWGSPQFVAGKMRDIADRLAVEIKEVGQLRAAVQSDHQEQARASLCVVNPLSSRACQLGTKSCEIDHSGKALEQARAEIARDYSKGVRNGDV